MTVTAPELARVAARSPAIGASDRRVARIAGVLFILTCITAIGARILFDPIRNDADYIVGGGADTRVFLGATLLLLLIVTNGGSTARAWCHGAWRCSG